MQHPCASALTSLISRVCTPSETGGRRQVAWWDEDITDLIRSLSTFAPYGSTITIVSPEEPKVLAAPAPCMYKCVMCSLAEIVRHLN